MEIKVANEFCKYCGAGIGKFRRTGEGTCPKCADTEATGSSETKSRAELVEDWRKRPIVWHSHARYRFAGNLSGLIEAVRLAVNGCADELEALESSSSADTGTTGAEGLREDTMDREIAFAQRLCANRQPHDWEMCEHCHYLVDSLVEWDAATQRAPVTDDEATTCVACPTCQTLVRPHKLRAPVTTPGRDEGPREAKLRRALRKYGVHQERCEAFLDECTCGLEAAAKEPRG